MKKVTLLIIVLLVLSIVSCSAQSAQTHFDNGKKDYDRGLSDANKAIQLNPQLAIGYYARGNNYRDKNDYDRAIEDYTEAIRLDPQFAMAYTNRGNMYRNKNDYDRAIADYTEAIRLDPQFAWAYFNRGYAYGQKNDLDHAIADFTEAIRLDPRDAMAYNNRGFAYYNKNDYDSAIADYTEAIKLDSKNVNAYYNRGNAYDEKKDYERAIANYTDYIKLEPQDADAYNNRGVAYENKNDYDHAITDYEAALKIDPNHPYAKDNLKNAEAKKGNSFDPSKQEFTSNETGMVYTKIPFSELRDRIKQINSYGQGFVVDAYFNDTSTSGEGSFSIGEYPIANPTDRDRFWMKGHSDNDKEVSIQENILLIDKETSEVWTEEYITESKELSHQFEKYDNQTYKRIDRNKLYRIYICVYNDYYHAYGHIYEKWVPMIDKIEGLRSFEEAAAFEAREKAEKEAAENERRQAREEANRYDRSRFTFAPSDFKPGNYTKVDLFKAVSDSRNLQRVSNKAEAVYGQFQSALTLGIAGSYILNYVSDLTFVRQNGIDIRFTTDDKAITQDMSIDERSGLRSGQKVRVYYTVTKAPSLTWDVIAIEQR
jgi:tetratricopeptide (TPR) repeat protein